MKCVIAIDCHYLPCCITVEPLRSLIAMWRELNDIMLSEISQVQERQILHVPAHLWKLKQLITEIDSRIKIPIAHKGKGREDREGRY